MQLDLNPAHLEKRILEISKSQGLECNVSQPHYQQSTLNGEALQMLNIYAAELLLSLKIITPCVNS